MDALVTTRVQGTGVTITGGAPKLVTVVRPVTSLGAILLNLTRGYGEGATTTLAEVSGDPLGGSTRVTFSDMLAAIIDGLG